MRGQMFGNLLNTIQKNAPGVMKNVGTGLQQAKVPVGIGLGVLGLGALGKAGVDLIQGDRLTTGSSRLGGESPGITLDQISTLLQQNANLTAEQAERLLPTIMKAEEERLRRGMEATRQVGQIQGDLARQKYGFQLAGGAQQVGLGTLQSLMQNPNPYAQTGLSGVSSLSL